MVSCDPEPQRPEGRALPLPHDAGDLRALFRFPARALDLVLAQKERFVATIASGRDMRLLVATLLFATIVFTLPFAAVLEWKRLWVVAALYLGSLAICLPSLHVFSSYLGLRVGPSQYLAFGLGVTAVAAFFTFGFFPIQWFLAATMLADSAVIGPRGMALGFLGVSLFAGVAHLVRCLRVARLHYLFHSDLTLIVFWQFLFAFITWRMALALDLA